MAQARGKRRPDWALTVVPAGTPAEARAVADRVLAMVAGWVQRDAAAPGSGPASDSGSALNADATPAVEARS